MSTHTISPEAVARRESARTGGRFGHQHHSAPGADVLGGASLSSASNITCDDLESVRAATATIRDDLSREAAERWPDLPQAHRDQVCRTIQVASAAASWMDAGGGDAAREAIDHDHLHPNNLLMLVDEGDYAELDDDGSIGHDHDAMASDNAEAWRLREVRAVHEADAEQAGLRQV